MLSLDVRLTRQRAERQTRRPANTLRVEDRMPNQSAACFGRSLAYPIIMARCVFVQWFSCGPVEKTPAAPAGGPPARPLPPRPLARERRKTSAGRGAPRPADVICSRPGAAFGPPREDSRSTGFPTLAATPTDQRQPANAQQRQRQRLRNDQVHREDVRPSVTRRARQDNLLARRDVRDHN